MCVNFRLCCTHFSCHRRKICNVSRRLTQISRRQRDPWDTNLVLIISHRLSVKKGQTQILCWLSGGDRLGVKKKGRHRSCVDHQLETNWVWKKDTHKCWLSGRDRLGVAEDRHKSHTDYHMSITDSAETPFHSHNNNNNNNNSNLRERWTQIKPKPELVPRATYWAKWETSSWVGENLPSLNFCFVFSSWYPLLKTNNILPNILLKTNLQFLQQKLRVCSTNNNNNNNNKKGVSLVTISTDILYCLA